MKPVTVLIILARLLFAVLTVPQASAQRDPLELIAPGLTARDLCPLVKNDPQAAIDAVANGAIRAYDSGPDAIQAFAGAMGAAVVAANDNGCINEVFEGVNQAIIKGGPKVEYVTGKALALGVAQGTASSGGQILAKATAVVICRGGKSASACAKAWNQAIKFDPVNGCAVLVQAFVHAKAYCSAGKAITQVQSTVFKYPLGECRAPGLDGDDTMNGGADGMAAGSASPSGSVVISQGPKGNQIQYPDGTTVTQGPGVSASVVANNGGWFGHKFGPATQVYQGPEGQRIVFGRKLLHPAAAEAAVESQGSVIASVETTTPAGKGHTLLRKLQQSWNPFYDNSETNANSNSVATNTGIINGGGVTANSVANSKGSRSGGNNWYGNNNWYTRGFGRSNANSAASATNTGIINGGFVTASSVANAGDR